jgi:type I restriction enzyme, S subunit
MSNKVTEKTDKAAETKALTPKLRFPEFHDAGKWLMKTIGDTCEAFSGGTPSTSNKEFYGGNIPFIRSAEIAKGATELFLTNQGLSNSAAKMIRKGDILVALYGANSGDVALAKIDGAINQAILCLIHETNNAFVYQYLAHKKNWIISTYIQGGQGNLSGEIIKSIELYFPHSKEQQKIADCLSSLDELIAAEAQKLDTLSAYKKGLMQQLFPSAGETQPTLRFPEFRDAGEWDVRTIGEMFRLINGCAFKPEDWKPSGTPIIRIQNLNDPSAEFNYSQAPVPERNRIESGDLLFAWSGTLGSSFGARVWNGPSGVLNQHIFKVLMDEQQITLPFSLLVLARVEEDIAKRTHGFKASFVHVKKSDLVKVELLLPSLPEQQRIAECLSSLDELIAAHTQKLERLKVHKKGLMQQLFPALDEVNE